MLPSCPHCPIKQQHTQLAEKEQELQRIKARLAACEQEKLQLSHTLAHTSLLLERTKAQYNDLMQVAEQYRQEAHKWYTAAIHRK